MRHQFSALILLLFNLCRVVSSQELELDNLIQRIQAQHQQHSRICIIDLVDDLEMSLPAASPENGIKIKHAINFISYDMNTTIQMTKAPEKLKELLNNAFDFGNKCTSNSSNLLTNVPNTPFIKEPFPSPDKPARTPNEEPAMEGPSRPFVEEPARPPIKETEVPPIREPAEPSTEMPTRPSTEEPQNSPIEEPQNSPIEESENPPMEEPAIPRVEKPARPPNKETEEPSKPPTEKPARPPTQGSSQPTSKEPTQPPSEEPAPEASTTSTLFKPSSLLKDSNNSFPTTTDKTNRYEDYGITQKFIPSLFDRDDENSTNSAETTGTDPDNNTPKGITPNSGISTPLPRDLTPITTLRPKEKDRRTERFNPNFTKPKNISTSTPSFFTVPSGDNSTDLNKTVPRDYNENRKEAFDPNFFNRNKTATSTPSNSNISNLIDEIPDRRQGFDPKFIQNMENTKPSLLLDPNFTPNTINSTPSTPQEKNVPQKENFNPRFLSPREPITRTNDLVTRPPRTSVTFIPRTRNTRKPRTRNTRKPRTRNTRKPRPRRKNFIPQNSIPRTNNLTTRNPRTRGNGFNPLDRRNRTNEFYTTSFGYRNQETENRTNNFNPTSFGFRDQGNVNRTNEFYPTTFDYRDQGNENRTQNFVPKNFTNGSGNSSTTPIRNELFSPTFLEPRSTEEYIEVATFEEITSLNNTQPNKTKEFEPKQLKTKTGDAIQEATFTEISATPTLDDFKPPTSVNEPVEGVNSERAGIPIIQPD
ncbi:proteoglycan 4 isoform X5 [Eurytemora carolleeae]|uniref:proteoglycan 4 isoform X5 n=1 Tax=Eurytemora carolleeae TaxID=1294199 RepID=UPI000C762159|nr:proteoglycan 4 isoform X5 [Eurytemora carolleeae]|eukprot:XP_023348929.1 proteoglycan 4-like isoform X5 [Eurytemora affinis]